MDPMSSTGLYIQLVNNLSFYNVPLEVTKSFQNFTFSVYLVEQQDKMYKRHMILTGLYIAAASLICIFAMAADLLHGLRNRKLWFPCNYFTINAAFLSVISVAMKLPMDMSNTMPGHVEQITRLGSMAFLCSMMANLLPSLATMNSNELRTNIMALGVMVITLVVNVCIQILTGIMSYRQQGQEVLLYYYYGPSIDLEELGIPRYKDMKNKIATTYVTLLLILLLIHTCSSLLILKSKKMIEVKYQKLHETALNQQPPETSIIVEKLRQHVRKYWIMAGTGSPQLITICSVTTPACGVICVLSTTVYIFSSLRLVSTISSLKIKNWKYKSDEWSIAVIFVVQSIGVILGTIAPLCRCFAPLCFEVSIQSIKNHIKVFKVERYWTQKLHDWRKGCIPFTFRSHKCKVITETFKILFLNFCIEFQEAVVVTCKIISLVPLFFMIGAFYCSKCFKDKGMPVSTEKDKDLEDLRGYVLKLQDEAEISGTTMKWLSISLERLIKRGQQRQNRDLIRLIEKSSDFKGVEMFDGNRFQSLPPKKIQICWSLSVVTLTAIALSLPRIHKREAHKLLRSVKAGLIYVTHVEQSLNTSDDYISIQKAAKTLWLDIEVSRIWFGNKLQDLASRVVDTNKTRDNIVRSLNNIAKQMVDEVECTNTAGSREDNLCKSICANSMYRITYTMLSNNIDSFNQQLLFEHISQMISGVLAACLANLPKVIEMKCHTCVIEKREANVQVAAQLLGETTEIINTLDQRSRSSRLASEGLAIY